jgi:GntR family transcriptional regulator
MSSRESLTRSVLYLQVAAALAERVASGQWQPGLPIPNETDLAREFGVSVGTMRKALDKLEEDRIVTRKHGRGTFVLDHRADDLAFRFSRIFDDAGRRVGDRHATVLSQEIDVPTRIERSALGLGAGQKVVRTRRLRTHDGRPCRYDIACLACERLALTDLTSVGDYLIVPLAQTRGVHLSRAVERLTIGEASAEVASLLHLEAGSAVLRLYRVIHSADDEPIEWRVSECNLQGEHHYMAEMG